MTTVQEFYAVFGELAVKFSNLEFMVSQFLQRLVDPSNPVAGGLLIKDMSLSAKTRHARQLAQLRYCHRSDLEERVTQTLAKVDALRVHRNAFIHGQWAVNPKGFADDTVTY